MDTTFMNSENTKTTDPYKTNLKKSDKYVAFSSLAFNIHGKI